MSERAIKKNDVIVIDSDCVYDKDGNRFSITRGTQRVCIGKRKTDGHLAVLFFDLESDDERFYVQPDLCRIATHTASASVYTKEPVLREFLNRQVQTVGDLHDVLELLPRDLPVTTSLSDGGVELVWTNIGRQELGIHEHLDIREVEKDEDEE